MYRKCQTSEEKAEVPPITNATWYGGQALVPSVCLGMKNVGCAHLCHAIHPYFSDKSKSWEKLAEKTQTNWIKLARFAWHFKDLQKILKLLLVLCRIPTVFL